MQWAAADFSSRSLPHVTKSCLTETISWHTTFLCSLVGVGWGLFNHDATIVQGSEVDDCQPSELISAELKMCVFLCVCLLLAPFLTALQTAALWLKGSCVWVKCLQTDITCFAYIVFIHASKPFSITVGMAIISLFRLDSVSVGL